MGLPQDRAVLWQVGKNFKGKSLVRGLASKTREASAKCPMSNSA